MLSLALTVGEAIDPGTGVSDSRVGNDSTSLVVGSDMTRPLDRRSAHAVCCEYSGNDVGGSIVDDECKVQAWGDSQPGLDTPGAESEWIVTDMNPPVTD